MENIKKMEMAHDLFQKSCVKVESTLFGLKTKVTYLPTNSIIVGTYIEYDKTNGEKVKRLFDTKICEWKETLKREGSPERTLFGNVRLSICYAKDLNFVAFQLFKYENFAYSPISEVKFAEGHDAKIVLSPFL